MVGLLGTSLLYLLLLLGRLLPGSLFLPWGLYFLLHLFLGLLATVTIFKFRAPLLDGCPYLGKAYIGEDLLVLELLSGSKRMEKSMFSLSFLLLSLSCSFSCLRLSSSYFSLSSFSFLLLSFSSILRVLSCSCLSSSSESMMIFFLLTTT